MEGKEKVRNEIVVDHVIPVEILDDLCSRFIINVPQEERKDLIRICFQIELAHWFYLDFYCTAENAKLKPCGMKEFTTHIFQHIFYLKQFVNSIDNVLEQWRDYKQNVPTFGAILLNDELTHVLLVQSYWARTSWGFPKGKVNKEEDPTKCAVREVLEETGFDISKMINANEFIESVVNDQLIRLYIVTGIPFDTKFQPQTRNEIKSVEWFLLADLPRSKTDQTPKRKMGVGSSSFFMVIPFVKRIKRWVSDKQGITAKSAPNQNTGVAARRQRHKSMGDIDTLTSPSLSTSSTNVVSTAFNNGTTSQLVNSKIRKQFSSNMQTEFQELQLLNQTMKNLTVAGPSSSPPRNTRARHDKEKKQPFKRKLNFNNNNNNNVTTNGSNQDNESLLNARSQSTSNILPPQLSNTILATSWINFKFNRDAILTAFLAN